MGVVARNNLQPLRRCQREIPILSIISGNIEGRERRSGRRRERNGKGKRRKKIERRGNKRKGKGSEK